jgi:4-hydroxy-tetrahydrodipicolinate synthase
MKDLRSYTLWTALVTPLHTDLSIDFESLGFLLQKQNEAGNGIVLFGSTGEGLALDESEKREILRYICSLNLQVPIMVGVGGINLKRTLSWIDFCETMPIDAYQMVTPPYSRPGHRGQLEWFTALLNHVSKPTMLYNVPSRTGCSLSLNALQELQSHPHLWALKECSGTATDYHNYRIAAPKLDLYSGDDAFMPHMAGMGAKGLISVVANAWPRATQEYVNQCLAGQGADLIGLWYAALQTMSSASNPVPIKALLHEKGWIKTPCMRAPLSHLDFSNQKSLREADARILEWEQSLTLAMT